MFFFLLSLNASSLLFKLANFGNDERSYWTFPLALTDVICTSNLIIETFSQLVFSTFIFKIEQFAKSIALGMWMERQCSLSYHPFTTQRKLTPRGLIQYRILRVNINNEIIAALPEAHSFLTFSLSSVSDNSGSGFCRLLVCGN